MRRLLVCAGVVIGLTPAAPALVCAQEGGAADLRPGEPVPAVPVHDEPHHRQLFQYGPMRILELQLPGGDTSWFHSHEWPVLYVTLSQGQMRTQNLGGEWSGGRAGGARNGATGGSGERGAAAGQARAGRNAGAGPASPRATSTTGYAERPVTHRIQNTGTGLVRAMVVVNETRGDETVTEEAAGFSASPELSNRWFRAYRIALAGGEKTPSHRHRAPVAIIQATAGTGVGAGAMTFEFNEPGQWAFFDAEDAHEVRNTGEGLVEFIEVEVRRK